MGECPEDEEGKDEKGKKKDRKDKDKAAVDRAEEAEPRMAGVIEPSASASDDRRVDSETVGVFAAIERATTV
ncbi:hypothetical protein O1611_g2303 [Lasiodiplodia mahajangana]|uniref:Uncharacterized protein n=1 Tax=Lasiodiplodia mahajangana TaxID=1108764 RepID=A0ACC2JV24_9PEZI|nr:hypothetical protein O1611_g2303 [Lasiodiplodia mahajangana]